MRKKVKRRKLWVFPSDSPMGWNTIFDGMDKSERSPAVAIEFLDWRRNKPKEGAKGGKRFPYSQWRIVRRTEMVC
jgi:hypothetical protein